MKRESLTRIAKRFNKQQKYISSTEKSDNIDLLKCLLTQTIHIQALNILIYFEHITILTLEMRLIWEECEINRNSYAYYVFFDTHNSVLDIYNIIVYTYCTSCIRVHFVALSFAVHSGTLKQSIMY